MIGKTISHYKILEEIGRGGMGEVYLAEDTKLKRKVALKFLHPELTRDEETKKRFIHEAQIASTLEHTNICTIHEIGETKPAPGEPGEGQLFISMAYYKGETLKSKIEDSPFKIYDLIGIAIQITQGLARAHESNIIHRDLKPANIIITDHGEVKIVDFGLAKLAGQTKLTKEGTTLGTVAYMSPEQSRGEAVDLKTDIWSIGVMLYEMITGQLPFKGDYEQAILYSIMNDEPEPVTALRTGVPMELERIVNKCLSKNPEVRYQHADDLSADLKKLQGDLEGSKQTALPVKEIQKLPEQKLKRIAFYAGFLLFITILIISAIYLYDRFFKPEESQTEIVNQPVWENSIAVLPFKNISPDPEQEYFCDGITEQIITNLTKLNRLKVIARTSVMKFKDTKKTIPEIGKELNVAHVLEGSVRKSGTRIRVTAQLIKTEDGYHLWAEDYDRELSDIFTVQDDVSRSISEALLGQLNQESLELIKTDKPEDIELYDNYLRAKNFHYKFLQFQKPDYLTDAIRILTDILDKEPDYLDATIELADVYNSYYNMVSETAEEKMQYLHLQEKYIEKAYQLNPKSSDVLYVKMLVSLARYEADHPGKI
jgi:non-specific serine/threonine protein kinase